MRCINFCCCPCSILGNSHKCGACTICLTQMPNAMVNDILIVYSSLLCCERLHNALAWQTKLRWFSPPNRESRIVYTRMISINFIAKGSSGVKFWKSLNINIDGLCFMNQTLLFTMSGNQTAVYTTTYPYHFLVHLSFLTVYWDALYHTFGGLVLCSQFKLKGKVSFLLFLEHITLIWLFLLQHYKVSSNIPDW